MELLLPCAGDDVFDVCVCWAGEGRSPFLPPLAARPKSLLLQVVDLQSQVSLPVPHLPGHAAPAGAAVPHWGALNMLHFLGDFPLANGVPR